MTHVVFLKYFLYNSNGFQFLYALGHFNSFKCLDAAILQVLFSEVMCRTADPSKQNLYISETVTSLFHINRYHFRILKQNVFMQFSFYVLVVPTSFSRHLQRSSSIPSFQI